MPLTDEKAGTICSKTVQKKNLIVFFVMEETSEEYKEQAVGGWRGAERVIPGSEKQDRFGWAFWLL